MCLISSEHSENKSLSEFQHSKNKRFGKMAAKIHKVERKRIESDELYQFLS